MDINGLAAIVTGGASGLGAATAELLAARGAKVTLFDLNAELGAAQAAKIGGRFALVNVTDEDAVTNAIAEAEAMNGKARILVNCAGIGPPAKVLNRDGSPLPLADFAKIININLIGSFNVLSKFASRIHDAEPLNEDGERGVIINTASVAAFEGQIGQPAYAASKGGIVGMALPIAREFRPLWHPRETRSRQASSGPRCSARCRRKRRIRSAARSPSPAASASRKSMPRWSKRS